MNDRKITFSHYTDLMKEVGALLHDPLRAKLFRQGFSCIFIWMQLPLPISRPPTLTMVSVSQSTVLKILCPHENETLFS